MNDGVRSRMAVFLFTDIEDSTSIQGRMGTEAYLRSLACHDSLYQETVVAAYGGRVVERTGDGFLAELGSPSDAVNAALQFQERLRRVEWPGEALRARCAIHLGELTEHLDPKSGETRYAGLAINLTARLMDLGRGGQILMSRAVFDDARRNVRAYPSGEGAPGEMVLRWEAHGRYVLKGVDEPMELFEVGVQGISPFRAPADSSKAKRYLDAEEELTLGWRPAVGLGIPRRNGWLLERKIGEGGFGEVWLARHQRLQELRVFKFCFDAARLRSLRREVTLFRLLREALGDREDIARIYEIQVENPPFFLESEYCVEGHLAEWAEHQGGIAQIPLATRLDLLARTARAAAAAHSVGVIHKDIKPANVLIVIKDGRPHPRLADFGIGVLSDPARLEKHAITAEGLTATLTHSDDASRTGTRLYAAPEYLAGGPATTLGDVYALGVMLYQLIAADLGKPLSAGWERDVTDDLLREDIAAAVDGDVNRRISSAAALADRIQQLDVRRLERAQRRQEEQRQERQRQRRLHWNQLLGIAGVTLAGMVLLLGTFARQHIELGLLDCRIRWAASWAPPPAPTLGVVAFSDLTERALHWGFPLGQPYGMLVPRHLYGRVLRELVAQGARAVAFDILFLESRPDHSATTGPDGALVDSDTFLAREIASSGRAILATLTNAAPAPPFRIPAGDLADVQVTPDADGTIRRFRPFEDCRFFHPLLVRHAERRGFELSQGTDTNVIELLNFASGNSEYLPIDEAGMVRMPLPEKGFIRAPAYVTRRIWQFGIVLAARELGVDLDHAEILPDRVILRGTNGVVRTIPLDREGRFLPQWSVRLGDIHQEPFEKVLEADMLRQTGTAITRPAPWTNKLAVVAMVATGSATSDFARTPLAAVQSGTMTHLNVANAVLQDRYVRKAPGWLGGVMSLLFGIISLGFGWRLNVRLAVAVTVALGLTWFAVAFAVFLSAGIWIPIVSPVLALAAGQWVVALLKTLGRSTAARPVGG